MVPLLVLSLLLLLVLLQLPQRLYPAPLSGASKRRLLLVGVQLVVPLLVLSLLLLPVLLRLR